ncbi:MAG: MFS transporter [Promethearchaeota archaeon]
MTEKAEEQENIADLESEKKIERQKRRKARKMKQEEEEKIMFPTKMTRYIWFVIFFASIVNGFDTWCSTAITLAMGSLVETYDILGSIKNPNLFTYFGLAGSPVMLGVILSIAGTGVIAATSFKYLVDRYGRRPLTLLTAVFFTLFSVLTAFAPATSNGLIIFLIFRVCSNYFLAADVVVIIVAEESPNHLRGRLIGIVFALSAFGGTACGMVQAAGVRIPIRGPWGPGGFPMDYMTVWQSMFFLSIIGYLFIIPLFFFLRETGPFKVIKKYEDWRKKKGLKPKTGWFTPLQWKYARGMAAGCVVGFLAQLMAYAQGTFFAIYFAKELNLTPNVLGVLAFPVLMAGGVGLFIAGPVIDKWGRLPTIHRFGVGGLIAYASFVWPSVFIVGDIPNPLITGIVIFSTALGVFCVTIMVVCGALIGIEYFPTHIRSTAGGWIGAISRGAVMAAPIMVMFGAESIGGLGLSYQYIFALMGMPLTTIMFTAYLLGAEGKGRRLDEIVASEIYTKMKKDKLFKKPYYYYFLAMFSQFGSLLIYGFCTNGTILGILFMDTLYFMLSLICFLIIIKVRGMVTEY